MNSFLSGDRIHANFPIYPQHTEHISVSQVLHFSIIFIATQHATYFTYFSYCCPSIPRRQQNLCRWWFCLFGSVLASKKMSGTWWNIQEIFIKRQNKMRLELCPCLPSIKLTSFWLPHTWVLLVSVPSITSSEMHFPFALCNYVPFFPLSHFPHKS